MIKLTQAHLERLRENLRDRGSRPSVALPLGHGNQALAEAMYVAEEFGAICEAMYLVMVADLKVRNVEREVLLGALRVISGGRVRTRHMESMLDSAAKALVEHGREARLAHVLEHLNHDETKAEVTFVLAAAVAAADNEIVPEEEEILQLLGEGLGIDEDRANELVVTYGQKTEP